MKKLALAAVGALVLSGCAMTTEVATQKEYAASDGIRVDLDTVTLENLYLLSDGSPSDAVLSVVAVNNTDDDIDVTLEGENITWEASLSSKETLNPATDENEPELLPGPFTPGENVQVTVRAGSESTTAAVPVLSACSAAYEDAYPGELNCPDRDE